MTCGYLENNGSHAAPMRDDTRRLVDGFYAPFMQRLARLLGDPRLAWPEGSTRVDAAALAAAPEEGGRFEVEEEDFDD